MQGTASRHPNTTEDNFLCPGCQTPGGYLVRIPRAGWRRLLFLKQQHYLCRECGHKFYVDAADKR